MSENYDGEQQAPGDCNGEQPCFNCRSFGALCEYLPSHKTRRSQKGQQYPFEAIQQRLSELETAVRKGGSDASPYPRRQRDGNRGDSAEAAAETAVQQEPDRPQSGTRHRSVSSCGSSETATALTKSIGSVTVVIRDMYRGCLSGYPGAPPDIAMGRVINSMMQVHDTDVDDAVAEPGSEASHGKWERLSPRSANITSDHAEKHIELGQVSDAIAEKLFHVYIYHMSTRWPLIHSSYLRQLHRSRRTLVDAYETTVLHMVYAIAGRFLETAGERGEFCSDQHCEEATKNLDSIIARRHTLQSIQVVLLFAIYNLRSPKGLGAWTYTGLAMRQCVELRLHREPPSGTSLLDAEMRKRIFWTCYCLDRQISMILGRPFAISDRDIDVELPLDVDESSTNEDELREAKALCAAQPPDMAPAKSTTITFFVYMCKLRMIESDIQQTIYRVDKRKQPAVLKQEVDTFMARLATWKASLPLDSRELPNFELLLVDGYHNYMIYFYKSISFLLCPVILCPQVVNGRYLKQCAKACGGVCRTYKTVHQVVPVGFSIMALHSIFMAGLTMLYCTWGAPREVFDISVSRDIQACSIVLYIIAERWVGARKYRDIFESVKEAVLEAIEQGRDEPRSRITNLQPGAREALNSVVGGFVEENGDFSAMMDDMIGFSPHVPGDPIEGDAARQPTWLRPESEIGPVGSAAPPQQQHGASSDGSQGGIGGAREMDSESAECLFPLDNFMMDTFTMDFAVPEGMDMLLNGLVDIG